MLSFLNTKNNFPLHTLFISKLDMRCLIISRKRLNFNINVHTGYRFAFKPPGGLCCCSFLVGGIVVGDSLLIVSLWESVIVLCFVVRYFIFTLVLQSS